MPKKETCFTSNPMAKSVDEIADNPRGRVCDLVVPVIFLIIACVIGMIYSGGFFAGEDFITAFSNSDASVGLVIGSFAAIIFTVVFYLCRRVLTFKDCMDGLPEGFKAMVPAIMILCCAWTLKTMTDSLGAKIFISQLVEHSAGSLPPVPARPYLRNCDWPVLLDGYVVGHLRHPDSDRAQRVRRGGRLHHHHCRAPPAWQVRSAATIVPRFRIPRLWRPQADNATTSTMCPRSCPMRSPWLASRLPAM